MITTYITDIHGEYEGFTHAMRTGSGILYSIVDEVFNDALSEQQRNELATFVAYPEEKMRFELSDLSEQEQHDWLKEKTSQLGKLFSHVSDKFNCESSEQHNFSSENLQERILTQCSEIKELMTGKLFVLGDIYDRGPAPERVIEELKERDDVHILWGNHDMAWIGAAAAHPACVATVTRICARYSNLDTLTRAYGINLDKLLNFASTAYKDDPCAGFALREEPAGATREQVEELMRVQKAIAIIQFKIEKEAIDANPTFNLSSRELLHCINYSAHTITLDGQEYALKDAVFPTVDPSNPYKLTTEEKDIIDDLCEQFKNSARLQDNIQYLLRAGSLYTVHDNNLLLHACVPLDDNGALKHVKIYDSEYEGKALFDAMDAYVRDAFFATSEQARERGRNVIWYLWLGAGSPLFAKSKMATFEMYFVQDKSTHKEVKNAFYSLDSAGADSAKQDSAGAGNSASDSAGGDRTQVGADDAVRNNAENPSQARDEKLRVIFDNFTIDSNKPAHIICGHVPIKISRGESPVKCGGKLLMIDGGLSHAYQPTSGIGGITLVSNAGSYTLNELAPLPSTLDDIIKNNTRTEVKSSVIK